MAGHGLNPNRTAHTMSNVVLGIAAGLVFGVASVAMMLPMVVPGQVSRAERGVCGSLRHRCCHRLRPTSMAGLGHRPDFWPAAQPPSAIITKAYAPVLVVGALGGLIIGGVIHGWLPRA